MRGLRNDDVVVSINFFWVTASNDAPVIARIRNTPSDRHTVERLRLNIEQLKFEKVREHLRGPRFRTPTPRHRRDDKYDGDDLCWFHATFGAHAQREEK